MGQSEAKPLGKLKGIYYLKINGKYYIGKDVCIERMKRIKEHLWLLRRNAHYNPYLQNAYNKYKDTLEYGVLLETNCTLEELSELEKEYIEKYDSYRNGYNLTIGGEGIGGYKLTEEQIEKCRVRMLGAKNPQAKLTAKQFFEIVMLLKEGKTNKEIAELYNLHPNYVSLIRHKKRFKHLWRFVKGYTPIKSEEQLKAKGKVTEEMFLEIVEMINNGATNAEIERKFGLSAGTASRIRHRKLYKQWWIRYVDLKERSTTIPKGSRAEAIVARNGENPNG